MYIDIGLLSVYGTTIRGCGVMNTIYQVVNSTYGYTWGFPNLATVKGRVLAKIRPFIWS